MRFTQNKEDGSCNIYFSEREQKIINEKGQLYLSAENLRHFGNHLVKIVSEWQVNFSEELKNKQTLADSEVPGE